LIPEMESGKKRGSGKLRPDTYFVLGSK